MMHRSLRSLFLVAALASAGSLSGPAAPAEAAPSWQWAGWGGGGFYYAVAFHPTLDGVIYLGGDVAGVYKSEDHGLTWRLANNGLADYGVFSLAVDRTAPGTVYASTAGGLCKSTDGAAHWRLLPGTGPDRLRLSGEKGRSVRCLAVDPVDGRILYAGSPSGKILKSTDGGESWKVVHEKSAEKDPPGTLRVQFGKTNEAWHGGFWFPLAFPKDVAPVDCAGFGFSFQGDGTVPQDAFLTLKTSDGTAYRSKNLREIFKQTQWGDIVLEAKDFSLDPEEAKKNPEKAKAYSGTPDWSAIARMDFVCVGPLMNEAPVGKFGRFFFALTRAPDGQAPPAGSPIRSAVKEFADQGNVPSYGNIRMGSAQGGSVFTVAVAQKEPSLVLAATEDEGVLLSRDAGATWTSLTTPQEASSVAVAPSDPSVLYATFTKEGVWKSTDQGQTWKNASKGLPEKVSLIEVAVNPADPMDVSVIGANGWTGYFAYSRDGGQTWTESLQVKPDPEGSPTLPEDYKTTTPLSVPKNISINPLNPKEYFIAANWRSCHSADGGQSWSERVRGADISCVYDLRFHKGRTYAAAMDEGVLASDDHGQRWRALWPLRYDAELSGHHWRLAISDHQGGPRILSTCSPWNSTGPNRVVVSEDGGQTFTRIAAGLPETVPTANTMWGTGYPRALAADPRNPDTIYLGIDGDPSPGKSGGGVFKTEDGGKTWRPLPSQPASRRMFFGLAVDPTDSKRLFWGACGTDGGLYRSEDSGASWQLVFKNELWIFNVHLAADGTVYCPGKNLWRSSDHGTTWKQITDFPYGERLILGLETDPTNPRRIWFATTTWDGRAEGGVFESTDGGGSWQEITGDLPYRKPMILRFNPETRDLWAAGVCLFKCRR